MSRRAPGGSSRRSTTTTRGHPDVSTSAGGASDAKSTIDFGLDRRRRRHDASTRRPRGRRVRAARRGRARWAHAPPATLRRRRPRRPRPRGRAPARAPRCVHRRRRTHRPRRAATRRCAPRRLRSECKQRDSVTTADERTARAHRARWPSATHTIVEPSGREERLRPARAGRATAARRHHTSAPRRARHEISAPASRLEQRTLLAGDAERRTATRGPHHRHPIHSLSATTSAGGPSEDDGQERQQLRVVSTSGVDVVGDDPAAHAPAVQRHAHDRADAHARGQLVGNQIVEDALDGSDVGRDSTDPHLHPTHLLP